LTPAFEHLEDNGPQRMAAKNLVWPPKILPHRQETIFKGQLGFLSVKFC